MRSRLETSFITTVYIPVIFKNYPLRNIFGITIYTLDEAGGLDQVAQVGTAWTRNGFNWNTIEPIQGLRNWNINLEQGLI